MLKLEERIRKYEPLFGQWYLGKKIERLGKGNSGTVFAIHKDQYDSAHKRVIATLNYALKVVPIPKNEEQLAELRRKCRSEEEVRRHLMAEKELAQKEIDIMERLWSAKSNNIVFFENNHIREREDTYGWDVLICMERLERLDKLLENYKAYKLEKPGYDLYMRIWSELLDGLRACEGQNIVHLDIKPENIFYGPPGLNRFKLGDFGVSAKTEADGLAEVGMRVGTIEYMAPEVHKGAGGDTRSDMYSLAMVIYQLLNNNRLPFQSMGVVTREDSMRASQIRIEGKTPIPRINGVDAATMNVLLKCLEPDPRNRYQSVAECKQALMEVVGTKRKRGKLVPILAATAAVAMAGLVAAMGFGLFKNAGKPKDNSAALSVIELPAGEIPAAVNGMQMNLVQNFALTNSRASVQSGQYVYSGNDLVSGDVITVWLNGEKFDEIVVGKDGKWTYTVDKSRLPEGVCAFVFAYEYGSVSAQPFIYDKHISQPAVWNGLYAGSRVVNGIAEPNSIVGISGANRESIENGKLSSCAADENGWFTLDVSGMNFSEGEKVLLQCSDLSGNVATPLTCQIAAAPERMPITITSASTCGFVGEMLRMSGVAEPRSKVVAATAYEEKFVDVDPSGYFVVDILLHDGAAAVGDVVTFRYSDANAADSRVKIGVDTTCEAIISYIPSANDPVLKVTGEPGSVCAITVDRNAYIEAVVGEDGIAEADLSACNVTGASQISVLVTDPHRNQYVSIVQANVSVVKWDDFNRGDELVVPENTESEEDAAEEEASEVTEESVAQAPQAQFSEATEVTDNPVVEITIEPTPEPTAEPTPEPTRRPISMTSDNVVGHGWNAKSDVIPGRFSINFSGEPGETLSLSVGCSFMIEHEQRELTLDALGEGVAAFDYASEGRVTVRARYFDQPENEAAEFYVMIDGKAPELFIGEVSEGEQILTGTSEAGANISLAGGGIEISTTAGENGAFALPNNSYSSAMTYTLTATDASGNSQSITIKPVKVELVYDPAKNVPVTTLSQTSNSQGSSMITVNAGGACNAGCKIAVFVNGVHQMTVTSGSDGKWNATLMLPGGENSYEVKAMYTE